MQNTQELLLLSPTATYQSSEQLCYLPRLLRIHRLLLDLERNGEFLALAFEHASQHEQALGELLDGAEVDLQAVRG